MIYKSLKPPDPGATSQGPAGGDGWYVFEWRRISPAFPLRVKGEPCVGGGRLARWVALPPAITLSWVTTRRWPPFRTWPPPPHWKAGVGAGRPPARSVLGTESAARLRIFFQPLGEGFPPPYAPRRAPGRPHRYFFEREPVTLFERNFSNKVPCSILDLSLGPSRTQDKENSCRIASFQQL